jgi:hypothetical protein
MLASDVSFAHKALCQLLSALVAKWAGIRETFAFAGPGDHDWAKGNARWINGLSAEIEALDLRAFASAGALCDAVTERARTRPWDPDYDEPLSVREEVLAAVAQVRAEIGAPQGGAAIETAPVAQPAVSASGTALDLANLTDDELARRISEISYLATGMAANDMPLPPELELEGNALLAEQSRRRN